MERRAKQYENNWCVYMHENRVNGKKYIGITSQKPTKRWKNGEGYQSNPRFYNAIQKYGWDAFRHDILFTDLTQDEAEQLEVELIAKYETLDAEKGYNLSPGGRVFSPTGETRAKISASLTGRPRSAEHCRKLSEVNCGENHHQYGKPRSEQTRRKISEAIKGAANPHARAVQCVETGVIYPTLLDAAAAVGGTQNNIYRACSGERKTHKGYHWRYAEAVGSNG